RWLVLGFDGAVFLLFLADAVLAKRATRPGRLHLRRERPARLSLGVDNEIVLVVENRSGRRRSLVLRDQPPPLFPAVPGLLHVSVAAHSRARVAYRLLPTQRGNFAFGDVAVRCRGPLGLACADRVVPLGEAVQVYPNLLEVRRYEALV